MAPGSSNVTRRHVLELTGGSFAAVEVAGAALASGAGGRARFNVGYSAGLGREAALDVADEVVREFEFDALTIRATEEAVRALRRRPDVRYVEADGTMRTLGQVVPWGVDRIDADVAHANGETGDGADVAVLDTGIDDDHRDLRANVGQGTAFVECGRTVDGQRCAGNGNDCNYPWSDDHDHGTHCAGIVDAVDNAEGVVGVSTEATLHAVKVFDCNGAGSYSDIAAGIEWTADHGHDVCSMGFGGDRSAVVEDAVEYASRKDVLLVAAAGNDGPCFDCVRYPAAYPEVIAVSATNCYDELAFCSSTGPEVELAAPGEDVYSTVPGGYDTYSCTSMACSHVAGAGAQLMADGYTAGEARRRLAETAEDIGLSENEQGNGLVDVAAALGYDSSDDGTGDGPNC